MKTIKAQPIHIVLLATLLLTACGGGGGGDGDGGANFTTTACSTTATDTPSSDWLLRIHSESNGGPVYNLITTRRKSDNSVVTMDYMVHPAVGTAKGLLVLIAGGQLTANIYGSGATVTSAGGNFLVRSAHLFAAQGYKVITLDRPDDYADIVGSSTSGWAYDPYRTSMMHAVDISKAIATENSGGLDVFIAGTSRGAISAVANASLSAGIGLSSPVTSGSNGTPVGSSVANPASVQVPAHVLWNIQDGCSVSTPAGSQSLLSNFNTVTGDAVSGGFTDPTQTNPCRANTYHGFMGIETCAAAKTTDWVDSVLLQMQTDNPGNNRPSANAVTHESTVTSGSSDTIDLSSAATDTDSDSLTFSAPYTRSSLDGSLSITAGGSVNYTAPTVTILTEDTFVYVVSDGKGGTSHNVVTVPVSP